VFWVISVYFNKRTPPEVWHIPPGTPCINVRVSNPQGRTGSRYITTRSEVTSYFHKITSHLHGDINMCDPWRFRNVTLSHDFPKKRAKIEQVVRE